MNAISVQNLQKTFKIYSKKPGLMGSLTSLVNRTYIDSQAVKDISFSINEGELVGFIGPNGAGKTTTLKCLSGLLHPSGGNISVLGYSPYERKHSYLSQISLVMGQKNQLWWDLPAMDTFLLNKEIYQISDSEFKVTLDNLTVLLDIKDKLNTPVRNLSLGERMKCELAASLLHKPKVLFLDEPTIGLDIVIQQRIREFIKQYNKQYKATIILTSHYMDDVKELCERIIIIDHGSIIYDGKLADIVKKYAKNKLLTVVFSKPVSRDQLHPLGEIKEYNRTKVTISVPIAKSNHIAARLLEKYPVNDLNIEETSIEDIIRDVFTSRS